MNSYRSHRQNLQTLLYMIDKGRFRSRREAAIYFGYSERTITTWLNELKEEYDIYYSRSMKRYVLRKGAD